MDAQTQRDIAAIKSDISSIVTKLENISSELNSNFKGIGNERCAQSIANVASKYKWVKTQLDNINTSSVTEEYKAAHRDTATT